MAKTPSHFLKFYLLVFGLFIGLVGVEAVLKIEEYFDKGAKFENLASLRSEIEAGTPHLLKADGSHPFVDIIQENPNDKIIYELRPNLDIKFTGVQVQTNSFGMRNPDVTVEKPERVKRIALLGDSFAFGWGVPENQDFAHVIEDDLNKKDPNQTFQVLNFGVPGYSTFQEVEVFKEKILQFNPDAVLVFFIDNDFEYPFFVRGIDKSPDSSSLSLVRLTSRAFTPDKVQKELKEKGLDPNTVLAQLDEICREKDIKLYLSINPRKDWHQIQKKLSVLQEHPTIHFIDIGDSFDQIVHEKGYSQADLNLPNDPHPTALRHKIYGDLLAAQLGL